MVLSVVKRASFTESVEKVKVFMLGGLTEKAKMALKNAKYGSKVQTCKMFRVVK